MILIRIFKIIYYSIIIIVCVFPIGCTKFEKQPDFYLDESLKKVTLKTFYKKFFVGNYLWGLGSNTKLLYKIDLDDVKKEDLVKYFLIAYNEYYKTNYNAVIDVKISDRNLVIASPADAYNIHGVLLEIEE